MTYFTEDFTEDFTEEEKRVLLAGMVGGRERDAVWSKFPSAIAGLGDRGLVRIDHEVLGNGTISSFPLCLSPAGVAHAKMLRGVNELASER